jgi:hypothetical protein
MGHRSTRTLCFVSMKLPCTYLQIASISQLLLVVYLADRSRPTNTKWGLLKASNVTHSQNERAILSASCKNTQFCGMNKQAIQCHVYTDSGVRKRRHSVIVARPKKLYYILCQWPFAHWRSNCPFTKSYFHPWSPELRAYHPSSSS